MEECLNSKEKVVLDYLSSLWNEKYSILLNVAEDKLCQAVDLDNERIDNIMRGLIVRGYFRSCNFTTHTHICTKSIELTEKALIYFNKEG